MMQPEQVQQGVTNIRSPALSTQADAGATGEGGPQSTVAPRAIKSDITDITMQAPCVFSSEDAASYSFPPPPSPPQPSAEADETRRLGQRRISKMSAISMNADAEALVTVSALVMPPNYHQECLTEVKFCDMVYCDAIEVNNRWHGLVGWARMLCWSLLPQTAPPDAVLCVRT